MGAVKISLPHTYGTLLLTLTLFLMGRWYNGKHASALLGFDMDGICLCVPSMLFFSSFASSPEENLL